MTQLDDIKKSIEGNSQWVKFGAKAGDPFLSIFTEQIKKDISQIEYEVGKAYKFIEGKYEYKILVLEDNGKKKFEFYIREKEQTKPVIKKKNDVVFGLDSGVFIIASALVIVGVSVIMLLPFIFW